MNISDELEQAISQEFELEEIEREGPSCIRLEFVDGESEGSRPTVTVAASGPTYSGDVKITGESYSVSNLPGYNGLHVQAGNRERLFEAIRDARDRKLSSRSGGPTSRQWG